MNPIELLTLEIPRTIAQINTARKTLSQFLLSSGIHDSLVSPIELAIFEVLINIAKHASSEYVTSDIILNCRLFSGEIVVIIEDYGELFDPTVVVLPNIEEHYRMGNKQGLGIFLVRSLMDSVQYQYSQNMNRLTMRKRLNQQES